MFDGRMTLEFSRSKSIKLIELIERNTLLWDRNDANNGSLQAKKECWNNVAAELKVDVEEAKKKFLSLLASFRKQRQLVRESVKKKGEIYRPRWFGFDKMKFLLSPEERRLIDDSSPIKAQIEEDDFDYPSKSEPIVADYTIDDIEIYEEPLEDSPASKRPCRYSIQRPVVDLESECDSFCQYLASKLRKYSPTARAHVEHAINEVLFQADLQCYKNSANRSDSNHDRNSGVNIKAPKLPVSNEFQLQMSSVVDSDSNLTDPLEYL